MGDDGYAVSQEDNWTFACTHPDYPSAVYDFGELAEGAGDKPPRSKSFRKWLGGFSGRPGLLKDLMPTMIATYSGRPPISTRGLLGSLRCFWRFLDAYEDFLVRSSQQVPRIDHLHQVSGALLELFSQPGPDGSWQAVKDSRANVLRALILDAVLHHEIPPPSLTALATRPSIPRDTPSDEEGLAIIRHLRAQVTSIYDRWQRADRLAAEGRDLIELHQQLGSRGMTKVSPTEADAHATYRSLTHRCGEPLPTVRKLNAILGIASRKVPGWWPRYDAGCLPERARVAWSDCVAGLYPTSADVATCALLCLARTAWNPAPLLTLDIDDWHAAYDQDHAWIYARKDRSGGALQHTISAFSHPTGVYQTVTRLTRRNAPLRAWLVNHRDVVATPDIALRSPWLGASDTPRDLLFIANPRDTTTLNNWLKTHIERHNVGSSPEKAVRRMTCSDFRDLAAALMYRESRYSMWVLMLMLGHKNIGTTRRYGYRHASRNESHRLVAEVVNDAFDQISSTGRWDAALTRAKVEGVEVTPDALQRLDDYRKQRTYSGAICNNPFSPPRQIDPTHPNDGRTRCVQGHLCVARRCPRATVLNDSLTDIAKTVAGLEFRQARTGIVRFSTGTAATDLAELREVLKQWPKSDVDYHIKHWRDLIERGEHRPIWFGGQH